eukprot:jgi/Botrbrau1/55/Bobra.0022s0049.1
MVFTKTNLYHDTTLPRPLPKQTCVKIFTFTQHFTKTFTKTFAKITSTKTFTKISTRSSLTLSACSAVPMPVKLQIHCFVTSAVPRREFPEKLSFNC